jgi:hypothetical protein
MFVGAELSTNPHSHPRTSFIPRCVCQARHAAISLAVCAAVSLPAVAAGVMADAIAAVGKFVDTFFAGVKAPLKKTLLTKMTDAVKTQLGNQGTSGPKTSSTVGGFLFFCSSPPPLPPHPHPHPTPLMHALVQCNVRFGEVYANPLQP